VSAQLRFFLCVFFQNNEIYEQFQSVFRPHHSSKTVLIQMTIRPRPYLNLDLSAAFDTNQLQNSTGVQGQALR